MSQRTKASVSGPAGLTATGLSDAQVAERVAAGQVNDQGHRRSRLRRAPARLAGRQAGAARCRS